MAASTATVTMAMKAMLRRRLARLPWLPDGRVEQRAECGEALFKGRAPRRSSGHQNLTFSDPTNDRPQPGMPGASSKSWSNML